MPGTLPFVTAPETKLCRVGREGTGVLELREFGKVRLNERLYVRPEVFGAALLQEAARLADAIAKTEEGLPAGAADRMALAILNAALGGQQRSLGDAERRAVEDHAEQIGATITRLNDLWLEQRTRSITAMIRFRIHGCQGWTDDDTVTELHDELQQEILAFYDREEAGGKPAPSEEEAIETMLEQLGKFTGAMTPSSPPTGESSTGTIDGSGPTASTPLLSDLESSPPTKSSRRSRKETSD